MQGLDAIVPPVGGGGLLSGTCLAVAASGQSVRVHAAEPQNADDAARSLATGVRQPPPPANTICEGLKTALGEIPWAIIKEHVQSIEVVDDDQVLHAWRAVLREARIIIEPACCSRRRRFDGGVWALGLPQSRPHPDRGQHRSGPDSRIPQPNRLISR